MFTSNDLIYAGVTGFSAPLRGIYPLAIKIYKTTWKIFQSSQARMII